MSSKTCETNLDEGILDNTEWVNRWAVGDTSFHQSKHDKFLDEKEDVMFGGKTKSLFLPLCGKSPDILWMYKKGQTVGGVEIAEQPIRELFDENGIEVEIQTIDNVGKLYQSKDGRLKMYVADLFDLSAELCGQYDVIWDSRSLVAINLADHQRYRELLLSLMKKDGLYFLSTLEFDPTVWPGPPHSTSDQVVRDVFSAVCSIDIIEETERPRPNIDAYQSGSENDGKKDIPTPSAEALAIKTSPYLYFRWYKITFKTA